MSILFNKTIVNSNQTILFIKNSAKQTYQIYCSSANSNPDVNLTLYDTNTLIPLSSEFNSFTQKSCNLSLCLNILQVNFQFTDDRFDNMTSFTCAANSSNPEVPLATSINQNVSVIIQGRCLQIFLDLVSKFYFFITFFVFNQLFGTHLSFGTGKKGINR